MSLLNIIKKVSLPNTSNADDRFQQEVDQRLSGSLTGSDDSARIKFDISGIIRSIKKLKRNKASGPDGICNEHLIFAGPQLCIHLCLLFNAMLIAMLLFRMIFVLGSSCLYLKANTAMRLF